MVTRPRFSTRTLLYCAVFAGVQALFYLTVSPIALTLATLFPPAYAVAAGAYSCMLFAARLFIGRTGSASLTAAITGILIAAVSPIGLIVLVILVVPGITFDLVLLVAGRGRKRHRFLQELLPAALISALILFAVSLPAFSADHLTPAFLAATLLGRALGQVAAALIATALVTALSRAGVRSTAATPGRSPQA